MSLTISHFCCFNNYDKYSLVRVTFANALLWNKIHNSHLGGKGKQISVNSHLVWTARETQGNCLKKRKQKNKYFVFSSFYMNQLILSNLVFHLFVSITINIPSFSKLLFHFLKTSNQEH